MIPSLPEERALMGKADSRGIDPVQLDPYDLDIARYHQEAKRILDNGGRFENEDLHTIVARLVARL